MNAWLVTWGWIGDHAKVHDPLIAIFSARRSTRTIADYVEQFYLMASSTAKEAAYYMNRPHEIPYEASKSEFINRVPHGNRIRCGHNPHIYARKVSELRIEQDREKGIEVIYWKEPPTLQWEDERRMVIEISKEGRLRNLKRELVPLGSIQLYSG